LCNLAHKERSLPKDQFKRGVEKELTGRESEPWETIYFKLYKNQIPIVEQAIETAALMLGTDKSRGYCLEMICADFLAGASLDNGNPAMLLHSISSSSSYCLANSGKHLSPTSPRRPDDFAKESAPSGADLSVCVGGTYGLTR
jgi:hypothetical protein